MENTSQLLFDDKNKIYFVVQSALGQNPKALGPLSAQEVADRIHQNELTLVDYLWKEDWSDWKKICDDHTFDVLIPKKPSAKSIQSLREKLSEKKAKAKGLPPSLPSDEEKIYYLYFQKTQFGPFSKDELEHVLQGKKIDKSAYVWIPGWPNWKRILEIPDLAQKLVPPTPNLKDFSSPSLEIEKEKTKTKSKKLAKPPKESAEPEDKRTAPRKPLVARLFLHNNDQVILAVCRDISIGGMQVLTDKIPGDVGSTVKLNVSPGDPSKVKGFVAEGEIVRVLEDKRGFSFRFTKISSEAKKTIEDYIEA